MKYKFIGGSKHGMSLDIPKPGHPITSYTPNFQPIWSLGSDDPVDHKVVDIKHETYTMRKIAGPTKVYDFYALSTWTDDDILELFFT